MTPPNCCTGCGLFQCCQGRDPSRYHRLSRMQHWCMWLVHLPHLSLYKRVRYGYSSNLFNLVVRNLNFAMALSGLNIDVPLPSSKIVYRFLPIPSCNVLFERLRWYSNDLSLTFSAFLRRLTEKLMKQPCFFLCLKTK